MSPYQHAKSSREKWGGAIMDYIEIHKFIDSSKLHYVGWQHRAVLHSTFGIGICEQVFGDVITNSVGKSVEVRYIAMQHIQEDCGFVPTVKEWLSDLPPRKWMLKVGKIEGNVRDELNQR